jgi:hypothetical protein
MPFVMIKGTFHIKGYSPDGDSIRFKAHNQISQFKRYLEKRPESVFVHSRQDLTTFDKLIEVSGNEIKMKVQPEDLIFMG